MRVTPQLTPRNALLHFLFAFFQDWRRDTPITALPPSRRAEPVATRFYAIMPAFMPKRTAIHFTPFRLQKYCRIKPPATPLSVISQRQLQPRG
jgi:hypothetical protein